MGPGSGPPSSGDDRSAGVRHVTAAVQLFGGYWNHFDWKRAIADGMASVNLPFSGEYDFVETEMFWKVNHMVTPTGVAAACDQPRRASMYSLMARYWLFPSSPASARTTCPWPLPRKWPAR
jgi:hypothetical protein